MRGSGRGHEQEEGRRLGEEAQVEVDREGEAVLAEPLALAREEGEAHHLHRLAHVVVRCVASLDRVQEALS